MAATHTRQKPNACAAVAENNKPMRLSCLDSSILFTDNNTA
jgi:hypothetical protein